MKHLLFIILTFLNVHSASAASECDRKGSIKWVVFEGMDDSAFLIKTNLDDSSKSILLYSEKPNQKPTCEVLQGPYLQGTPDYVKLNALEADIGEASTPDKDKPWLYYLKKDLPNKDFLKSRLKN